MSDQNLGSLGSAKDVSRATETPTHGAGPIDGTASPSKSTMLPIELAAGSTLGPYRILTKLGEGGMGSVYKATHEHLDKTVAVKVLPPAVTQNADAVARFKREMKAVGKLDHPHIVRAMDAGEVSGTHYLAMEYVDGTDLQQLVRTRGPLSVANACKAVRQAAMALMAAHGTGLVHRDVKPSNLLVGKDGQIKLLDLGLARLGLDPSMTTELTQDGQTFGTPDYMAPEQWADAHNADARADLYSLGCTLFYLLVGRAPFGTEQYRTMHSKMRAHSLEAMPDLAAIRADVPAEVCAIYQKLTAKQASDRYQSAADVVTALTPWTKARATESRVGEPGGVSPRTSAEPASPRPGADALRLAESVSATNPLDVFAQLQAEAETQALPANEARSRNREISERDAAQRDGSLTTSATKTKTDARGPRAPQRKLLIAAAVVGLVVLTGIVIKITNKDGTVTEIKVPDGAKVEVTGDGISKISNSNSQISNSKGRTAEGGHPTPAVAPFTAEQAKQHQEAWAKHLGVPVEYTNSIGMKFVLIPPGEFLMGSTPEEVEETLKVVDPADVNYRETVKTELPRHKVLLTKAIYLGAHEVTQRQYQEIIGTNPSAFGGADIDNRRVIDAKNMAVLPEGTDTSDFPVDSVSWNDAAEFCAKLSQKEKFKPSYFRADNNVTMLEGNGYRLPTEAEWEFACRAGTTTRYWSGDKDADLLPVGWFGSNAGKRSHEVGELKPNPFGLYDVHGNLWEWVQDWWEPGYYDQFVETAAADPMGAPMSAASRRVIRGGRWHSSSAHCRASPRGASHPTNRPRHGFRVSLVSVLPRVSRP